MTTQTDSTNTSVLWTIVLVGAFAMIAISAAVTAMVRAETNKLDSERPRHADVGTVVELKQAGRESLAQGPAWLDREHGTVKVPIDVAKQLVLNELVADPATASPPPPPGLNLAALAAPGPTANAAPAGGAPPAPPAAAPPGAPPAAPPPSPAPSPAPHVQ